MRRSILLGFLALTGCASAPAYQPSPVVLPASFRETTEPGPDSAAPTRGLQPRAIGDSAMIAARWQELGDSTLTRLIEEALRTSPDVRTSAARVRGARAARRGAQLDFGPTVTFAGGYTRQRLSSAGFPIASGRFPDQDVWDAGFDAAWELDLFGRVRRSVQAQGALVQASREDLRDVQVSLAAELARSYFELRGAQEQLTVARQNAENQRRTLEVTQQRLDAGRGTAFDTERATAQLSSTLAIIPSLEAQVAAAQYGIGVLVGRPPAAVAEELQVPGELPRLPAEVTIASPDSLVRRRPDVAFAERQFAAGRALVGAAKAEYLPRISVGGSAGYSARTFGAMGDAGTFRYAVGPVISWPAFNLGRVKAGVDASRARADEAEAQYQRIVLVALQEIETALARYRSARATVEQLTHSAAASERAAELARLRFAEGITDFLQVLDAERTQLESQSRLAQGRTDAATSYATLYKALGGEWNE